MFPAFFFRRCSAALCSDSGRVTGLRNKVLDSTADESLPGSPPARQDGVTLRVRVPFRRGDANADGARNIADAICVLRALFLSDAPLRCVAAADANDDNGIDIGDAIAILGHLFRDAGPLPEPFASCGADPTPSDPALTCLQFPPCPAE